MVARFIIQGDRMKFLSLLALSVMASSAFAADQFNFKLIGFSKDNKKVAFVESVIQDGSGHGIAVVSVVDVKANNLLKKVDHRDEGANDTGGSEEVAIQKAIAKANLKSFGIDSSNKGQVLLERLATDASSYSDTVFSQHPNLSKYSLSLSEKTAQADCSTEWEAKMMKLSLSSVQQPGLNLVLQEDRALPRSRGCVLGYGISKVIKSGDALVVILNKATPGFEGPDSSFLAVTAEVKLD